MIQVFLEGFLLQAGLIFALGAQNLYVLESGLRKHHRVAVSFTCFLCDFFIIMLGVLGTAVVIKAFPQFKIVFGVLGIGFMLHYGLGKFRPREQATFSGLDNMEGKVALKGHILKAIMFSVINPHAYLDGIVLIGGYASKYPELSERAMVGLGASIYSLVWFLLLSGAASAMAPILSCPRRMRLAMSASGMVLVVLSLKLSVEVYGWYLETWEPEETLVLRPVK